MAELVMPRLSDSMEEGTIVRWLIGDGEEVAVGAEVAEIETDKANMPYEAEHAGQLRIVVAEGETVPVGTLIGYIGDETPGAAAEAPGAAAEAPGAAAEAPGGASDSAQDSPAVAAPARNGAGGRFKASPVARRMAADRGIDLSEVSGSGPSGRIVKADVEAHASFQSDRQVAVSAAAPAPPLAAGGGETAKGESTAVELSRLQELVVRRMSESKATAPDFALARDLRMDAAVELRESLRRWAPEGRVPSYNDLVIKACALALRDHPRVNGAYRDGRWELYSRINVGFAVAAADGALIVPTIADADRRGLGEIAEASRRLAGAARDGSITPPELSGGTFTVSNLGMFGVDAFTAIINPPQAAILAVGALQQRVVAVDGEPAVGWRMTATLCCDHRILSGADGAAFLARVSEHLESPGALVL